MIFIIEQEGLINGIAKYENCENIRDLIIVTLPIKVKSRLLQTFTHDFAFVILASLFTFMISSTDFWLEKVIPSAVHVFWINSGP